ncbi:N-acetylmuramoyl-L-alanine amidase [Streptomyces sp. NPDC050703]|uniref:peptidoglycan recognition protein family protein n=1 Tax=Streptomyces sp. NPDC050703 TaxID=3157218 RepID=UPI00342CCD13
MRGFLASSIGVTCAAALALPLTLPTAGARAATPGAQPPAADAVPGTTQSLPLGPLDHRRSAGPAEAREQGLSRRDVRPYSLVGVVWDDPDDELHGTVQVRTRPAGGSVWSDWRDVETHNHEHAADPDAAERAEGRVRGSTAPLWVGDSDGVEIRVRPETATGADRATAPGLPGGLRLELVDPGDETPPGTTTAQSTANQGATTLGTSIQGALPLGALSEASQAVGLSVEAAAASTANSQLAPLGATVIPELTKQQTEAALTARDGEPGAAKAKPYIGPRPRIVTRKGWGADEKLRERNFAYTKTVKAAFLHHTATGNNYSCRQAPSVLRSIYRYHVKSSGWRDLGYNFAIDKCGNIYEGRAGGVAKAVLGAHTLGFNTYTTGIAVIGTYSGTNPPKAAVSAISRLTAWKLGLHGRDPSGTTTLKSGGGNLYKKGANVRLRVISGHRDGFATACPGSRLYKKLGTTRSTSARLQGR